MATSDGGLTTISCSYPVVCHDGVIYAKMVSDAYRSFESATQNDAACCAGLLLFHRMKSLNQNGHGFGTSHACYCRRPSLKSRAYFGVLCCPSIGL